jgi:glutamate racemase
VDQQKAIGIFDSGIGGLTVANAISKSLPNEKLVYFGDTAHLPYGEKSADAIRYYSLAIGKFLLEKECKAIVIACNSASSAAYHTLQHFFEDKAIFINVVDPLVDMVTADHDFKKVGIIATKATVESGMYQLKIKEARPDWEVAALPNPLLVPMIEEGFITDDISDAIIHNYLEQEELQDIDALLLACTHYPLIRKHIQNILGPSVQVFDSIDAVTNELKGVLESNDLLREEDGEPEHHFYVSDLTPSFEKTTRIFYPEKIHLEHCQIW